MAAHDESLADGASSPRWLTPKRRFAVWAAVVVIPPACNLLLGIAVDRGELVLARAIIGVSLFALTLMVWLLITTPPDAIKLRFWVSVLLILLGAVVPLVADMAGILRLTAGSGLSVRTGALFAMQFVAMSMLPVIMMRALRAITSPWAAAPALWHPLLTEPAMHSSLGGSSLPGAALDLISLSAVGGGLATLVCLVLHRPVFTWVCWLVSVAATIALTL